MQPGVPTGKVLFMQFVITSVHNLVVGALNLRKAIDLRA